MTKQAPLEYRYAAVAVDIIVFSVFDNELQVLTTTVNRPPHYVNVSAFVGGIVGIDETADAAVTRHLKEKAHISRIYTEQLYTFTALERDKRNRVIAIAYIGLMDPEAAKRHAIEGGAWVPVRKVGSLAYDHNEILGVAKKRLAAKCAYTNIARYLLPKKFTLSELQQTYEIVEGREIDKRNFRKKILSLDIIEETGERQEGVKNRPAALYTFTGTALKEIVLV